MKLKPHNYQKKTIKFFVSKLAGALFMDPGLGKTLCVLLGIEILMEEKIVKKTLIIGSVRIIYSVWPREIKKWGFDFKVAMVHGDKKLAALKSKADIYLINYEGILWLKTQAPKLQKQFDVLVLDESTKVKNWSSQRFKALKKMLNYYDRRYILTGTPIPNGLIDLFSQIYVLDHGEALGTYITHYRNEYFHNTTGKVGRIIKGKKVMCDYPIVTLLDNSEKKIKKAIKHEVIRFDDSLIKMPKRVTNFIEVELPKKVRAQYEDMETQLAMDLKKKVILASNAGVATMKLRQLVNGHVFDNDRKSHIVHEEKLSALVELVEELQGSPLLVGYEFKADLAMMQKALPHVTIGGKKIKSKNIGGGVSAKEGAKIERDWNKGKIPLLFGQIASVSHGLNLQESGNHLVFYSLTWNLEDYQQFIRRVWRQGQKKTVYVHHIVAENSVDLDVWTALKGKDKTQKALLDSFRKRVS